MRVCVFYHDNCFDGACSASLFTRFHRERIAPGSSYEYHGLLHRAGALFDESEFNGDENAIVDFKYSPSPRVTWWFDHHLSAFLSPQDQQNFLACKQDPACGDRKFCDPNFTSCTSFIAAITSERFGFDTAPVAELIKWADIVDGAKYDSPASAVAMAAPAMKLTLIIEAAQNSSFLPRLIPLLTERFHFRAHLQPKTLPVYDLVVQRGGPKIKLSQEERKDSSWNMNGKDTDKILTAKSASMADLAQALADEVHREVIDKTGLQGAADITLKWTADEAADQGGTVVSIFTAVEEQLGLKLQPSKGPVDTLVIDHAEAPSEN